MKEIKLIIESSVSNEELIDYIKRKLNLNIIKISIKNDNGKRNYKY